MQNVLKGMPGHLEDAEGIQLGKSTIDYISLNVPPACNFACDKCFTLARARNIDDALTTDQMVTLAKEGSALGAKVMNIIGEGEPLLYLDKLKEKQDLRRVIETAHAEGMTTVLATNGSLLDKSSAQFLYEHNVTPVVSLDTMSPELYRDMFKGAANFEVLMRNLEYTRKLFAPSIYTKNERRVMRLGIHMTVTTRNMDQIDDVKKFCGNDIYFDCDYVAPVGAAVQNPAIYGSKEIFERCRRASRAACTPMVDTKTACGKHGCALFFYGFAVGYEGEVMIDTHAVETKYVVGHVTSAPMSELIKKSQAFRDAYFENYGEHPCIIRNERYRDYLAYLDKHRASPFPANKKWEAPCL